jgi:UDP-N-acetylmuramoyl-tripeptide--D-alanyl-D-alanine ligase
MNLTINQIKKCVGAVEDINSNDRISGFCIDSRLIKPGDCFFAIKGENLNGEDFLADVFAKGAACALVSKDCKFAGGKILKVDDAVIAMGKLAHVWRNLCGFSVVAVTGSAGKTTTRDIIHHILSGYYKCHKPIKNFNNHIGLPYTLLTTPEDTQVCVVEMGANHVGEIEYLSKIAGPDIALITNTYPAHLEGFGSIENIIKEKSTITAGLKSDGCLIINDKMTALKEYLKSQGKNFDCFNINGSRSLGLSGILKIDTLDIEIPLAGAANLENATAAYSVCKKLGITASQFAERIKTFKPTQMRMEIFNVGKTTLISDCYNANPAAMENAIEVMTTLAKESSQRTVFVCGDMKELGHETESLHIKLGKTIRDRKINLLLAVGEFAKITASSASENSGTETRIFKTTDELADNVNSFVKDDDIVLVKGSRAAGLEKVIDKLRAKQ